MFDFSTCSISELDRASSEELDEASFGIIGFKVGGESRMAGLSPDRVLGRHVFAIAAPCMNNYLVAQRFEDEGELDDTIDFVLTLRMRPTPVKIRMLKSAASARRFLLIERA